VHDTSGTARFKHARSFSPASRGLTHAHVAGGRILRLAGTTADDCVYDLGCGDGRICIAAAKDVGARAVGIEIEPGLIAEFEKTIAAEGLDGRVRAICGDIMEVPMGDATVISVFLLPEAIRLVRICLDSQTARDTFAPKSFPLDVMRILPSSGAPRDLWAKDCFKCVARFSRCYWHA
jgi:SAM-dependent methyltransferase